MTHLQQVQFPTKTVNEAFEKDNINKPVFNEKDVNIFPPTKTMAKVKETVFVITEHVVTSVSDKARAVAAFTTSNDAKGALKMRAEAYSENLELHTGVKPKIKYNESHTMVVILTRNEEAEHHKVIIKIDEVPLI